MQENIYNEAPVRRIAIAVNTNSALQDSILKIPSGIDNLISVKLEYSEEVRQSYTLMLLKIVAFMLPEGKQWTFKKLSPQFQMTISKTTMY